jgi:hypothetical protein
MERRALDRVLTPGRVNVARSTERTLLLTVEKVKSNPALMVRDAKRFPAEWTLWQVRALMALGWTEDILEERAGMTIPRKENKWVNRNTFDAVDALFMRLHHEWGPSRMTAVTMWRKGALPPDCYNWEESDTRPIPGSMHHELVVEACTFTPAHRSRAREVRALLRGLGQWTRPECTRAAHRAWCEHQGMDYDDYTDEPLSYAHKWREASPWCRRTDHDHSVPEFWR